MGTRLTTAGRVALPLLSNQSQHHGTRWCSTQVKQAIDPQIQRLMEGLKEGSRASLATAITLVETENDAKKRLANQLVNAIMEETPAPNSYRIGKYLSKFLK